jgi:single-stranded-DNA-specific exonuclease
VGAASGAFPAAAGAASGAFPAAVRAASGSLLPLFGGAAEAGAAHAGEAPEAAVSPLGHAPDAAADPNPPAGAEGRHRRDVRGGGIAGLLGDLVASGERVLVVAAHAPRRVEALRERVGGFALCSWAALEDAPGLATAFPHVVALDPPAHAHVLDGLPRLPGAGWVHLAWGAGEVAFAERVHAWELTLRPPLAAVYRALRTAGAVQGARCEALLAGDGAPPRSAALAGRLVRMLAELGLADVERDEAGLRLAPVATTTRAPLEGAAAWRAYERRRADGETSLARCRAMLGARRDPPAAERRHEPAAERRHEPAAERHHEPAAERRGVPVMLTG